MNNDSIKVGISIGELMDKITILEIKMARIKDLRKVQNVTRELDELVTVAKSLSFGSVELVQVDALREVNLLLWDVEDDIRECEHANNFGEHFIKLARSVYLHNDRRARLKKTLNELMGSALVEEKSYRMHDALVPSLPKSSPEATKTADD